MLIPISHERNTARRWPWISMITVVSCIAVFALTGSEREKERYQALRAQEFFRAHPDLELDPQLSRAAFGPSAGNVLRLLRHELEYEASRDWIRAHREEIDVLVEAWLREARGEPGPSRTWGLVPAEPRAFNFVSSVFFHAGLLHLLGNLLFLWLCGPPLEDVWGRGLFGTFFLAAGIVANLVWVVFHPGSQVPIAGASGAVAGLMGAFMVRFGASRVHMYYSFGFFDGIFTAPAWLALGLWLGSELLMSAVPGPGVADVAHAAHVGGFLFGAFTALVVKPLERRVLAPGIEKKLGAETNPVVDRAHDLRRKGRLLEAWNLVTSELRERPENHDAALVLWDLAVELGRPRDAAAAFHRAIYWELVHGDAALAFENWRFLEAKLPEEPLSLPLRLRLGEALIDRDRERDAARVLADAREDLRPEAQTRLGVRWTQAVWRLRDPDPWALPARRLLRQTHCYERRLESTALEALGIMLWLEERFGESLENHRRGTFLCESLCGLPASQDLTSVDGSLESMDAWTGPERLGEALARYEKAEAMLGRPGDPRLASLLAGKSDVLRASGRLSEAENALRRACKLRQSDLGPRHPAVGYDLVHLGELLLDKDRAEQALGLLERALEIVETSGADPAHRSHARFALAKALLALDREPDRVERLAREALSATPPRTATPPVP